MYKLAPQLLGAGYDNCIKYLQHLIDLEITEIPSGTKLGTWTVPDEWVPKDAWVKKNGKKILDYSKDPLSLMVYSRPFKGTVDAEKLKAHLFTSEERIDAFPYEYSFYERKWGVCMPKRKIFNKEGKDKLKGKYEVMIDTEFKPGVMKIATHTIPGKTDREILLFAHIDHPHQANDNLSGVACLVDLVKRIKKKQYDHTIKLVFCPETIGSIGYVNTHDISKVDFMIAVDAIGNDSELTLQLAYDAEHRLNRVARLAMLQAGENFRMGNFRATIGSDEYVFNDPLIGIPGLMLTRHPYPEYHTSDDTPEIIKPKKIKYVQNVIKSIIETYEKDYIPVRKFKGPLMRSKYGVQTSVRQINAQLDYLFYNMDGKKWLSEIINDVGLTYGYSHRTCPTFDRR